MVTLLGVIAANPAPSVELWLSAIVFLPIVVRSTRAPLARIAVGAAAAAVMLGVDFVTNVVAYRHGWWSYPAMSPQSHLPLAWYAVASASAAGLSLIAWWLFRRYGARGVVLFVGAWGLFGPLRDWASSQTVTHGIFRFGPGAVPYVMDGVSAMLIVAAGAAVQMVLPPPR